MKKTAKICVLLLAVTMLVSLTACGTTSNTAGSSDTANTAANGTESSTPQETTGDIKSSIHVWCWGDMDLHNRMHQNFTDDTGIKVELTAVEAADMVQKLQTTMAAGGDMPDIAWCEATYRGSLLNLGIWEDITKEPYNFDKSLILDYLIDLETSLDGQYIGPECPTAAGLAYKRELTKEYFGTDDPYELEKILATWDDFLAKGQEVKEKSNGKVFMFSSLGAIGIILKGQDVTPFVVDNSITFEDSMKPILEKLAQFARAGIVDVLDYASAEEGASYAGDEHIFYPCASWSVDFTIKANDPEGQNRWGFMLPPGGGFPMGGTVVGVPKKAKNKEGAVEFIKYFYTTEKGVKLQYEFRGSLAPYKPIYESDEVFYSKKNDWFPGQDVLNDIATRVLPSIKSARKPVPYDQDIDDVYNLACKSINAAKGEIDINELLDTMAEDLITNNPELTRKN